MSEVASRPHRLWSEASAGTVGRSTVERCTHNDNIGTRVRRGIFQIRLGDSEEGVVRAVLASVAGHVRTLVRHGG